MSTRSVYIYVIYVLNVDDTTEAPLPFMLLRSVKGLGGQSNSRMELFYWRPFCQEGSSLSSLVNL